MIEMMELLAMAAQVLVFSSVAILRWGSLCVVRKIVNRLVAQSRSAHLPARPSPTQSSCACIENNRTMREEREGIATVKQRPTNSDGIIIEHGS